MMSQISWLLESMLHFILFQYAFGGQTRVLTHTWVISSVELSMVAIFVDLGVGGLLMIILTSDVWLNYLVHLKFKQLSIDVIHLNFCAC